MKPAKLRTLPLVHRQVLAQADYFRNLAKGEAGERLARRFLRAVDETILSLAEFPERGSLFLFEKIENKTLRRVSVSGFRKHQVFYQYFQSRGLVRIVQFRHGAQDNETLLQ